MKLPKLGGQRGQRDRLYASSVTLSEETSLARHPFRGLVRTLYLIGGCLFLAVVMWFTWAVIARHHLAIQIKAINALHQPFELQDFKGSPIPDEKNAAVLWKQAFAVLPRDTQSPSESNLRYTNSPPYPLEWHLMEDRSVILCADFFDKARIASAASDVNWGTDGLSVTSTMVLLRSESRTAVNTLADAIIHAHLHGDDALAIERNIELMQLSRALGREPLIARRLISIAAAERAGDATAIIAADFIQQLSKRRTLASRSQVLKLIQLYLDEKDEPGLRAAAIDDERLQADQWYSAERETFPLLRPLVDTAERRSLDWRRDERNQAVAGLFSAAVNNKAPTGRLAPPDGIFDQTFSLQAYLRAEWRAISVRRQAAVALAARLFERDHGRLPGSLSELIPAYLAALPQDPFASVGTAIPTPASMSATQPSSSKAANHQAK